LAIGKEEKRLLREEKKAVERRKEGYGEEERRLWRGGKKAIERGK
jgi:hypothetical protein